MSIEAAIKELVRAEVRAIMSAALGGAKPSAVIYEQAKPVAIDITEKPKRVAAKRKPAKPSAVVTGPNGQTWAGRGRKPAWLSGQAKQEQPTADTAPSSTEPQAA